ncbi:LysR family transcriptional regulator [Alcaligenaceae bacterium]|nr:LysR family transcriptional regulator [Alcaligenaceae bacterium]
MKLSEISDFIAIAETGSIRAAARQRGVTAPAMTQSIARLEEKLHVPLVTRTTKGVVLSDYGLAFLIRARLIVSEVQKSMDEMAQMGGQGHGQITFGTSMTPASTVIPHAIADFRRQRPEVRLHIIAGMFHEHLPRIRSGVMDFAIGPVPDDGLGADFQVEKLFQNDLVLTVRKESPYAKAKSLAELTKADWILGGPSSHGPGSAVIDMFERNGYAPPRVMVQSGSLAVVQSLLLSSDMICALPRQTISSEPLCRHVDIIDVKETMPTYTVSLFYRIDSPLSLVASLLATLVRRHAHYWSSDMGQTKKP